MQRPMALPKTILVPTDFSPPSEAALDRAVSYARAFGAEIILMHAYEIPVVGFPEGALVATAELVTELDAGARESLAREAASRAGSHVIIRTIVKQGDPATVIAETADEVGAGLICIGTHGRTGLSRMLLGSVAEKVVRTATVPVLTVHPDASVAPTEGAGSSRPSAARA